MDAFIVIGIAILVVLMASLLMERGTGYCGIEDTLEACRESLKEHSGDYSFYIGDVYRMSDDPFDDRMALIINVSDDGVYTQYIEVEKVGNTFEQKSGPHSASKFDTSEKRFVTNLLTD